MKNNCTNKTFYNLTRNRDFLDYPDGRKCYIEQREMLRAIMGDSYELGIIYQSPITPIPPGDLKAILGAGERLYLAATIIEDAGPHSISIMVRPPYIIIDGGRIDTAELFELGIFALYAICDNDGETIEKI